MTQSSERKHAGTGMATDLNRVAEPSFAERARTLMYLERIGALSTLSRKQHGFPFGSMMPYAVDGRGRPIFLISTMAVHTHNLRFDPRASLLVTQSDISGDPLGAARVTLLGNVLQVPESEIVKSRELYVVNYENSKHWVDFEDFSFYRMDIIDVYYVGGFGVMGWISAEDYQSARPDPLADASAEIIRHMNAEHKDALILLGQSFAGIHCQEATMVSIDRLGFHLRAKTENGIRGARITFLRELSDPAEARNALVEMVRQARQH